MTFPAYPYEVDEHLVAGLRSLYEATASLRKVPVDKLDPVIQMTLREAIGRTDAIKDAVYAIRFGKERTDDTPPVDLIGISVRKLSPVIKRVYELLADGEWHDYETVVREAAKEILPGEAHRYMESERIRNNQSGAERVRNTDDLRIVEQGQRAIVRTAISGQKRVEMIPQRRLQTGKKRQIRLRPSQTSPGGFVHRDSKTGRGASRNGEVPEPVAQPVTDAAANPPHGAEVTP